MSSCRCNVAFRNADFLAINLHNATLIPDALVSFNLSTRSRHVSVKLFMKGCLLLVGLIVSQAVADEAPSIGIDLCAWVSCIEVHTLAKNGYPVLLRW
jgi:uncharacterized membrane protein